MSLKKRTKFEMVLTVSVALLAVISVGVSTFAWFQANADVNIETASNSTNITVTKPDDFIFYAYKGNTQTTAWSGKGTSFDSDFVQITADNLAAQTAFDDGDGHAGRLNPGDIKTFALYFWEHTANDPVNLEITSLTSQTIKNALGNTYSRVIRNTSTQVNIGWAINMFSFIQTTLTDHKPAVSTYSTFVTAPTGTDRILLSSSSSVIGKKGESNVSLNGSNQNASAIDLYPSTNCATTEGYIFYAIEYSDAASVMCKEVDSEGATVETTGIDTAGDVNARLFDVNSSSLTTPEWNSNCYAGLQFTISTMNFVF